MAQPAVETDEVRDELAQQLEQTPYACSSFSRLSGGTANFVYRGIPRSGNPKSIVIKHAKNYLASNADFKLDAARCHFEGAILEALHAFPPYSSPAAITVKSPQLFHFDRETNTQIVEDCPDSIDLKHFLLSDVATDLSDPSARALGHSLGRWLRSFHDWAAAPEQAGVRATLAQNEALKNLKFYINYPMLLETIDNFPDVLGQSRTVFEQVRDSAAAELKRLDQDDEYGAIHGDFWTGNILLPNIPLTGQSETTVFVVDWEMCQIGSRALDLGQMIAELYETKLFRGVDAGISVINGLLEGYGPLSRTMAFRTAVHVGAHLVCWGSRVPGWGSPSQIEEVVTVGRDLLVHAWTEDQAWLEGSALACLFHQQ
ncbi:hypothetical protein N7462_008361 [Penicillium macrosclerotiorum]|uniref:uncharacterized protein n=1 Tax=Penicillium macrosclerotiorum TaxID=303699 RepID=UPI0025470043|nr:uncharacterized protein N7462_008361 [Penicillium macrosclerotiorum]KAJ5675464.1 hypothetical protein N7462_008361 [Penicillium macrosclerotiorum]